MQDAPISMTDDEGADSGGLAARRAAFALIEAVLSRRQALDEAIEKGGALGAVADPRDRAFARLMALTVLRRLGQIDQLIDRYMTREPKGKAQAVRHILRLGTAQIIFLGTPPHAAVDTAVALTVAERLGAFKGLVNAILRKRGRRWPASRSRRVSIRPDGFARAGPPPMARPGLGPSGKRIWWRRRWT